MNMQVIVLIISIVTAQTGIVLMMLRYFVKRELDLQRKEFESQKRELAETYKSNIDAIKGWIKQQFDFSKERVRKLEKATDKLSDLVRALEISLPGLQTDAYQFRKDIQNINEDISNLKIRTKDIN